MGESFDTHRTLLMEGVFRCELEWFILALAASTERAILMFWFQKEEEKSTKKNKQTNKQKKNKKRGAGIVSNSTHYKCTCSRSA